MDRSPYDAKRATKVAVAVVVAAAASLTIGAGVAGATNRGDGCRTGANLGAMTIDEAVQLPRTQAAIAAGLTTTADVIASYQADDKNGNGVICVALPHGQEADSQPFGRYYYWFTDDNPHAPGLN